MNYYKKTFEVMKKLKFSNFRKQTHLKQIIIEKNAFKLAL